MNQSLVLALMLCIATAEAATNMSLTATPGLPATNVLKASVSAPAGEFPYVDIYNPTLVLSTAKTMAVVRLAYDPNPETDLGGYKLFYGDVTSGNAPTIIPIHKDITNVVIFGLDTNSIYYFYITATNTSGMESDRSKALLVQPTTRVRSWIAPRASGDVREKIQPPLPTR